MLGILAERKPIANASACPRRLTDTYMTKKTEKALSEEQVPEGKKKITTKVEYKDEESPNVVRLEAVEQLEKASKVGFYVELRPHDDEFLEEHVRLMCESKDGESPATPLTPWVSPSTLSTMVNGCLFLYPLIMQVIRDRQMNAENPEDHAA